MKGPHPGRFFRRKRRSRDPQMWLWQEERQRVRIEARREVCAQLAVAIAAFDECNRLGFAAQLSESFEMEIAMRRDATRLELNRLKRSCR